MKIALLSPNPVHLEQMGSLEGVAEAKALKVKMVVEGANGPITPAADEILEDKAIQLVVSAGIPDERAPLGR